MLNKKTQKPRWALALVFLVLAALVLALFHSYTVTDAERLYLTPVLDDDGGWDIYRLDETGAHVSLTPGEVMGSVGTVYLSRILDPAYETAGYTTLELGGPVSVFLDGELLYTTAPGSGDSPEEARLPPDYEVPSAGETPRLTLPPGYGGKELTLVFERGEDDSSTPMVFLSNRAVEDGQTVALANRLGMPAAAYMTAAFLLLGLFLYGGFRRRWDWPLLLLALAAALQAFYQLREYGFRFAYHSALDVRAAALIPPLFVALPLGYLLCQMERKRGGLRAALVLLPAAVALIPGVCNLFEWTLPYRWEFYCLLALYLSTAVVLVCAVLEVLAGNRTFRLFLAGLGALLALLAAACLFSGELAAYAGSTLSLMVQGLPHLSLYWCGAALFVLCAVIGVGASIRRTAEGWARAELLSTQISALQSRMEVTRAADEAIRIERHDLRHKLQAVAGMVEKGETEEALAYIGASQAHLDELKPVRWCQNPVLDAIFSSYFNQANRQGIEVQATLAIPDELVVDAAELATVFANALENAIHACAELPEGERRIVCKCINRPQLMFEVANTYAGKVSFDARGLPVAAHRGHGIGTRSIAAFCEKYGAAYFYEAEDGWFKIRVVF